MEDRDFWEVYPDAALIDCVKQLRDKLKGLRGILAPLGLKGLKGLKGIPGARV